MKIYYLSHTKSRKYWSRQARLQLGSKVHGDQRTFEEPLRTTSTEQKSQTLTRSRSKQSNIGTNCLYCSDPSLFTVCQRVFRVASMAIEISPNIDF